jgi:outer membrane receptor protein involved in Fe transport
MRKLFFMLLISIPTLIFSQQKKTPLYTISGKIIDASTKLPLEDATIIFKSLDSTIINSGAITNQKGKFSVEVIKGDYNAIIEFLSYKTKKIKISSITNNLNIGTIELELDTELLAEIEIIGEKSTIEYKQNKVIYTVGKDIASNGGVATDILNNIPAVSVNPNGDITLRGFETPTVLINGKTSSLSKTDALKTIPANAIETIEVLTNPSAKYKSSATGIINIILVKEKDQGLNASITAAGGYKDYYGGMLTLNHKAKKVNFFTNTSYFHRNPIKIAFYKNEYFNNNNTISFLNEESENNNKDNGFTSVIGADFNLSDKATLATKINYTNISNEGATTTNSTIFDASKTKVSDNFRHHIGKFDDEIFEFIVDYEQLFNKEGQKLSVSYMLTNDNEVYNNIITNSNDVFTTEDYIEDNTLKNHEFSINFTNPIGESSTLTFGYLGEFGEIPFNFSGTLGDNIIDFSENINAGFVEFENEGEKFYFGIGLRAEFSTYKINYLTPNTTVNKTFNDFFPSTYLEYSLSENKSLSLSYNRAIRRPIYSELQPFEQRFSETLTYKGNPNLNPVYIDATTLTYTYYGNKITLSSSLFFNSYADYSQLVTYDTGNQLDGVNKLIKTYENLGKVDYYGVSLTAIIRASKKLNFTANANVYNFDQTGSFETINEVNQPIFIDFTQANLNGSFSLLTQLKLPNFINLQTNIQHNLISEGAISTRKAYTYANATISKDILQKNASINLTVDDIFLSNKIDRDRFDVNYFSKSLTQNKFRTIILSFTYRFNQSKKSRKINFDKKEIKPNY